MLCDDKSEETRQHKVQGEGAPGRQGRRLRRSVEAREARRVREEAGGGRCIAAVHDDTGKTCDGQRA